MTLRLQDIAGRTVGEVLSENRARYPDDPAMLWHGSVTTWSGLDDVVSRLAAGLHGLGVRRGDRVAIWLANCPELVHAYFAAARIGAVAVPLNPALTAHEATMLLADCAAVAVLLDDRHTEAARTLRAAGDVPSLRHVVQVGRASPAADECLLLADLVAAARPGAEAPSVAFPDDPVVIYYTSGTTGRPKGAVHTHFSVLATALSAGRMMELSRRDRVLLCTPLYHSAAMHTFLMAHALLGASWVVTPGFDPVQVLDRITEDRVTVYFGVVPMLIATLAVPDLAGRDLSSLRILFTGASPVPQALKQRCIEAFPGVDLIDGYGCTESGPAGTCLHARDALERPGSVGTPWPYLQVAVLDAVTGEPVGPETVGEVALRGPTEMLGYHNLPEETAAAFAGGWLHTGDLGSLDRDGFLSVTGRVKDMLIRGGVNVYPRETEEVLYTHPAVAECAVFGVPDETMGEEVMACVTLREGSSVTPEELLAHLSDRLAPHKRPCYVRLLPELPHNATGKVLKFRLQETYAEVGTRGPRLRRRTSTDGQASDQRPGSGLPGDQPARQPQA
ncbi:MAG TPA: AMP-binding protein [Nocardioidaceae bacterium]|jgi:fatty-acyl-CoA synthase|nr:AMP-binding protein [Nocardioidaceae bacterium]